MKKQLVFVLCASTAFFAFGQDAEPEEPGIELPPTLLEVEDLQVDDVSALIPDDETQLQPVIDIPLPEAEDIYLPEEQFDIPYPDQVTAGTANTIARTVPKVDIFSDGQIGVGSVNHVRGDLSLYRLGPDPKFNLRFLHDKLDGYGMRRAGAGFYHSDDILEGDLSFYAGDVDLGVSARIYEASEGLQQQSTLYEALTHRSISGGASATYQATDRLSISGGLDVEYSQQILASTSPDISSELAIDPEVGIEFQFDKMSLGFIVSYDLRSANQLHNSLSAVATYRLFAIRSLILGAQAEFLLHNFSDIYVPFSLIADGYVGDVLQYFAEIGYSVDMPLYSQLWGQFPLIDLSGDRGMERGWFWSGYIQARFIRTMLLQFDFNAGYQNAGYIAGSTISTETGLFPYAAATEYLTLDLALTYDWEVNPYWGFRLGGRGWIQGWLFQKHAVYPFVELSAAVWLQNGRKNFGGELSATSVINDAITVPVVQLSGFYRLSERIMIKLEVVDPLALVSTVERLLWDPYESPGFHVFLSTTISL